jgi:hypothetical protein
MFKSSINRIKILQMPLIRTFAFNSRITSFFGLLYHRPWVSSPARVTYLENTDVIEEEYVAWDQDKLFYPVRQGEILNNQYQITTKAGYGHSSTVWIARDLHHYVFLIYTEDADS